MSVALHERHAKRGKVPKLSADDLARLRPEVPGWDLAPVAGQDSLTKTLRFKDFAELMRFVNRLAALAEAEDHHPDFTVHYNVLELRLWTHDAKGLTENDLILAARIDRL